MLDNVKLYFDINQIQTYIYIYIYIKETLKIATFIFIQI